MHTVLDGDSSLSPQTPKGAQPPSFGPYQQWRNGWMDRDATWQEGRPLPKRHCVRWGPSSPPKKRGKDPQFSAHGYCGQTTGWIKLALGTGVGLGPGHIVLDGDPAPPSPTKRAQQPLSIFGTCLLWPNGRPSQQLLNSCYVTLWLAYRVALKLVK